MLNLKRALTYDEQVDHLELVHKLEINCKDDAVKILKKVNYYRLSGYGIGLKSKYSDHYQKGVTLNHIYRLYEFDSYLRIKIFHLIEKFEIQIKTQIAYCLSLRYGPEAMMNSANFITIKRYDGSTVHDGLLENFVKECSRQSNKPFVKHHIQKYGNRFPIWVAVELLSFGSISSLFSIMKPEDQTDVATLYTTVVNKGGELDLPAKYLSSWILSLVEIRNICAHHGRLYNLPLKQRPKMFTEHQKYVEGNLVKLFPALIALKRIFKDSENWNCFRDELEILIGEYDDVINFDYMGFPSDWKSVLRYA